MTTNSLTTVPFVPVRERGWRLGLGNILSRENRKWWGGRRWLFQSLLWTLVLDGLLFMVLFVVPNMQTPDGQPVVNEDPLRSGVQGFFSIGGMALAIGIVVLMQGEVIGEKQSGTAEWVLSKPAARSAFVLAKLAAHTFGMLIAMVLLPALVGYALLSLFQGAAYPLVSFVTGLGFVFLHVLFYLVLSLLSGVLSENRSIVLAAGLGSLLGGSLLRNFIPTLSLFTPWMLSDIAGLAAMGETIPPMMFTPILMTTVWILFFLVMALWKFGRYEF